MNLQDNIARMELELADMKKQLEQQDKLELKGGGGYIFYSTISRCNASIRENNSDCVTRGAFRATKELAKIADKNMVMRNRLEAYVHQIQGDGEGRYVIFIENYGSYTYADRTNFMPHIGAVYMQKETAEILCKALNAQEIEL